LYKLNRRFAIIKNKTTSFDGVAKLALSLTYQIAIVFITIIAVNLPPSIVCPRIDCPVAQL
jgi:hypothetical protein